MGKAILSVSPHQHALRARNAVLRMLGYVVEATMDAATAVRVFQRSHIDAVVLGEMSAKERDELAFAIHCFDPAVPIIALQSNDVDFSQASNQRESVIESLTLLAQLRNTLRVSKFKAA